MKERLTGAIILVALIVLLVPELLTGPIHPAPAAAANSSEEPPLRTYTIHLAEDGRSRAQPSDTGPAMPESNDPAQSAAAPQTAPGSTASDEASSPTSAGASPNRLGSTNSSSPAAAGSSAAGGASAAPGSGSPGNHMAEASQGGRGVHSGTTRSRIRTASTGTGTSTGGTGTSTVPPTAGTTTVPGGAGATPGASATGSGWMVQVGVFASRENAEHLARDLKTKGFKAAVSDVTSGNRHLFRVRVGPYADRAAAQDLQGRLRAAGRAGTVVPVS